MADPPVVTAGDLGVEDLLATLQDERRVVVRTEFLGSEHEVTLRWDGETYYCDTPTRLHKHDSEAEMRTCLRNQGYGRSESADE
jgi:hypothetical protein